MNDVDLGIWSKLTRVVIFLIVVAIALAVGIWYLPLVQQNERMRKEILRKDAVIQKEEAEARELRAEVEALRADAKAVERLAREKFGYAKPGETVVRFEDAATNASPR